MEPSQPDQGTTPDSLEPAKYFTECGIIQNYGMASVSCLQYINKTNL